MRLVYKDTGREVKIGDHVRLGIVGGLTHVVRDFPKPHKPQSSGHVYVRPIGTKEVNEADGRYYVGMIGAEWIEREDRSTPPRFMVWVKFSEGPVACRFFLVPEDMTCIDFVNAIRKRGTMDRLEFVSDDLAATLGGVESL